MKKALALLVNDLHVHKDNLAEFDKNWDEMIAVALKYDVLDIVVGGDVFTTRASQTLSTLLTVRRAIDRAIQRGFGITIANGNHDRSASDSEDGYNTLWKGLTDVEIVDSFRYVYWGVKSGNPVMLVMSYFPENGSFLDRLEVALNSVPLHLNINQSDIILYIHEGVNGALGDMEIEDELPQEALSGFKAVVCGHYHNRCKIKGTNIEYIGASRQHNFGEDEEKGYTILFNDGSMEFVKNEVNIRYKTYELNAADAENFQLQKDPRYKYRIKVNCDEKQAKLFDKQKFVDMGFDKVVVSSESAVSKDTAESGIQEKYDKHGITKEYQNYCQENDIAPDLGIKYLMN